MTTQQENELKLKAFKLGWKRGAHGYLYKGRTADFQAGYNAGRSARLAAYETATKIYDAAKEEKV